MRLRRAVVGRVEGWNYPRYERLSRRVRKLDTSTLLDYADMSGSGMSRAFGDLRRADDETVSLAEIEEGLQSLWAVVTELRKRSEHQVR